MLFYLLDMYTVQRFFFFKLLPSATKQTLEINSHLPGDVTIATA